VSRFLVNKNTGATRAGYTKCPGGCGEYTRCACPPPPKPKSEKSAKEKFAAEVRAFDQKMAKSAGFVRGSRWK
jgi:hypothetical protein